MNRLLIPPGAQALRLPDSAQLHALHGRTMGTGWSLKLCGEAPPLRWLQQDLQARLDRLDQQMSHWASDSDLAVFNRQPAGTWQTLAPEFFAVMQEALELSRLTGGAYDPGIGHLVNLWGFGPHAPRSAPPGAAQIDAARASGGAGRLRLDADTRRLFQPGGVALDLSSIAKGFAVDELARRLLDLGLEHFLVEVGGELRGAGCKPDGLPWWVDVERALPDAPRLMVALHGVAVATSGDTQRYFEHAGRRYAHTLDPRSGWPIDATLASVSVIHESCMRADALATALSVLGADDGMAFADDYGVAAIFLLRHAQGSQERFSRAAAQMLE